MKKYLRQFAESVTGSAHNGQEARLTGIRLSLGFFYVVALALMLALSERIITLFGRGDSASLARAFVLLVPIVLSIVGIVVSHVMLARDKREAREHAKMLSDVAHDLRNSLAVMKMTSEVTLMRDDALSPEETKEFIEGELAELDRMLRTIERLSANKPRARTRPPAPPKAPESQYVPEIKTT